MTYLPVTHDPELRPQRRSWPTHRQLAPLYVGVLGLLILLAVVLAWFGRGRVPALERNRAALGVMLDWMLVPSAALLIGTHVVTPMYSLRYLSICTPAAAIALGIAAARFRPRRFGITALVLHLHPASFTGLRDVTLDTKYGDTGSLWDTTLPLTSVLGSLTGTDTVWLVQHAGSGEEKAAPTCARCKTWDFPSPQRPRSYTQQSPN